MRKQWLRVRAKISLHSGASGGWADERRRGAGDVVHCRAAATQQMPARRRAPQGGRLSELQYPMRCSYMIVIPESRPQNVKLFLREPLAQKNGRKLFSHSAHREKEMLWFFSAFPLIFVAIRPDSSGCGGNRQGCA